MGELIEEYRSVSVPLVVEDIGRLRDIAAVAARYANEALAKKYLEGKEAWNEKTRIESRQIKTKNGKTQLFINLKVASLHPYTDYNQLISSKVRDAMTTEVDAVWSRYAKQVLAGHKSLPTFNSDRALTIREQHGAGVSVRSTNEDGFEVAFQFMPGGAEGDTVYPVYKLHEKKVLWLTNLLTDMASGALPVKKAAIVLDRRRPKKVMARITYMKTFEAGRPRNLTARVGPFREHGELYVRVDHKNQSLTHYIHRMLDMKKHFAGIVGRVRLSKRRKAMQKLRTFEDWAPGVIHQLSRSIVQFAFDHKAGRIEWGIDAGEEIEGQTLPLARLEMYVKYKAREAGIELVKAPKTEMEIPLKSAQKLVAAERKAVKSVRKYGDVAAKL